MKIAHVLLGICLFSTPILSAGDDAPRSIHSSGEASVFLQATVAEVSVGIEVSGYSSEEASDELARRQSRVLAELRSRGIEQLETKWFSLNPRYDADDRLKIIGYNAQTTIVFVTTTENAGTLLTAAINAGANKNQGIQLRPRPEEIAQAEKQAIQMASQNAIERIQAALDSLGLSFEKILQINLSPGSVGYQPVQRYAMMEAKLETTQDAFEIKRTVDVTVEFD